LLKCPLQKVASKPALLKRFTKTPCESILYKK
jgi:hypothetical protein